MKDRAEHWDNIYYRVAVSFFNFEVLPTDIPAEYLCNILMLDFSIVTSNTLHKLEQEKMYQ